MTTFSTSCSRCIVNGGGGERFGDGVDAPTKPASLSFPYVREPNKRTDLPSAGILEELTMDILKDKGAVVTGAASGIGKAIAKAFIDAGASVLLCDRQLRKRLEAAACELGERAIGRLTDVSDESQVEGAMRAARERIRLPGYRRQLCRLWRDCAADRTDR